MSEFSSVVPTAAPLTPIIFLIDTSGSMAEGPIEAVNTAMREAMPVIQEFAQKNPDVNIRCSVLEFNTKANWIFENIPVEDLAWIDLKADGLTALGAAYTTLNDKLSRKNGGFLQAHRNNAPILILLTDGTPTDDASSGLKLLKENAWFKNAIRIAIEIPGETDYKSLLDFAGSKEGIISVAPEKLKERLANIAVKSALIGSKSQGKPTKTTLNEILNNDDPQKEAKPDAETPDIPDSPTTPSDNGDSIFDDIFK